jgi:diaminohydroxyphosphoribosylaminopyrimidine deaminase/5-amino-6-(5-phosphoribosylamino)uracil reductase
MRRGRPYVTVKAGLSLDGKVAGARGRRTAVTGPDSFVAVHRERAEVDAIAVGSETLLIDDPVLTARVAYRVQPLTRVVFDRRLRMAPGARMLETLDAGPVLVFTDLESRLSQPRVDALRAAGAQVEPIDAGEGSALFLGNALMRLAALGVTSLVVEGGPALHKAFFDAGLVDRVELFVSPRPLGPDGVDWMNLPRPVIAGLTGLAARPVGEDVMIEGYVHRTD